MQLASMHSVTIVGTCSANGVDEARALGCVEAYDFVQFDPSRHKKAFDIVFDTAGSFSPRTCFKMLAPGGPGLHVNINLIKVMQVLLTRRNKVVIAQTPPTLLTKLGELAAQGSLKLPVVKTVSLDAAIAAITKLEQRGQPKGRLVIVPDSSSRL